MDELKPPPMSDEQIGAIYNPWTDCAGASFADLMTATAAARDQQWLALVGELREKVLEAAYEWSRYVEVDTAPRTLEKHMAQVFDADLTAHLEPK